MDLTWIVVVKYRSSGENGMPVGTLWRRLRSVWINSTFSDWREAKDLEIDLYYNGIKRIPDFSKL